ncbi:hypothetical protein D046_2773A, partial [Vibrio parahaemolyticus V-223/04]
MLCYDVNVGNRANINGIQNLDLKRDKMKKTMLALTGAVIILAGCQDEKPVE